jgi:hypothetical protein
MTPPSIPSSTTQHTILARQHRDVILAIARRRGVSEVRLLTPPSPECLELVVAFDIAHHEGLDLFGFAAEVEDVLGCPVFVGTSRRAAPGTGEEAL